ncbi:KH domain-containing protein, partial [Cucurbita argyrosperma subsp. sororia]
MRAGALFLFFPFPFNRLPLYLSAPDSSSSSLFLRSLCMMGERTPPGSYFHYPPPSAHASPHRTPSIPLDRERYLAELLSERQKLGPFVQVLPHCSRLLNQEIRRLSGLNQTSVDHERFEHGSPYRSLGQLSNGRPMDLEGWPPMQMEGSGHVHSLGPLQAHSMAWPRVQGIPTTPIVKRVVRLDVPVDKYPNYNFVGRLLGPRGNSLKRVEALTECRVYIRGKGSIKDALEEEKLKDKPGYEHLNEPLHLLVEAEFPEDTINSRLDHAVAVLESLLKPVDELLDQYKKQQLRELALLNGTLREESPSMSPSMSPFNTTGLKRAKTGR